VNDQSDSTSYQDRAARRRKLQGSEPSIPNPNDIYSDCKAAPVPGKYLYIPNYYSQFFRRFHELCSTCNATESVRFHQFREQRIQAFAKNGMERKYRTWQGKTRNRCTGKFLSTFSDCLFVFRLAHCGRMTNEVWAVIVNSNDHKSLSV
jgi:hypothetical protein